MPAEDRMPAEEKKKVPYEDYHVMRQLQQQWGSELVMSPAEFRAQFEGLPDFDDLLDNPHKVEREALCLQLNYSCLSPYAIRFLPTPNCTMPTSLYCRLDIRFKIADVDEDGYIIPTRTGVMLGYGRLWAQEKDLSKNIMFLNALYGFDTLETYRQDCDQFDSIPRMNYVYVVHAERGVDDRVQFESLW